MSTEEEGIGSYDPVTTRLLLGEAAALLQAIGFAGSHMIIIGGLVPGLLVPVVDPPMEPHVGSRDIDFCLSVALIEGDVGSYERVERSLRNNGFTMARDGGEAVSWRWVGGSEISITVEFFCPSAEGRQAGRLFRPGGVVGGRLSAMAIDSGAVIDLDSVEVEVEVLLPQGGGRATVPMRVTGLAAYLVAKADALARRSKEKDAYDPVWLIEAWPGGPAGAASVCANSSIVEEPKFLEAIERLKVQFQDIDSVGSLRYAQFLRLGSQTELDLAANRAVGAFREFFRELDERLGTTD